MKGNKVNLSGIMISKEKAIFTNKFFGHIIIIQSDANYCIRHVLGGHLSGQRIYIGSSYDMWNPML